jgi:hypothetical protein
MFRMSRASLLARLPLYCSAEAQHPQIPRFFAKFPRNLANAFSLLNHSALALFAQRTRIPTSARSIGFCVICVCISSSSREGGAPKSPKARSFSTLEFELSIRKRGWLLSAAEIRISKEEAE